MADDADPPRNPAPASAEDERRRLDDERRRLDDERREREELEMVRLELRRHDARLRSGLDD